LNPVFRAVIVAGGESGPLYHHVDVEWIRYLNSRCVTAGATHFFKHQHGGRTHSGVGCLLHCVEVKKFPTPALPVGQGGAGVK